MEDPSNPPDDIDRGILDHQLDDINHPCHNCPIVSEIRREIRVTKELIEYSNAHAAKWHEVMSEAVEELADQLMDKIDVSSEEVRQQLGQYMAGEMDEDEIKIDEAYAELFELVPGCEGAVSLFGQTTQRRIGVIACGSPSMSDVDSAPETVFITRFGHVE